ncbi:MAG: YggT family protein [Tepidibacter sp.]|jgi:YggT family protein|uniref:YggT family protein n=1 Tax=Tepidibacter sp. TaxID=2529387 RepID=UPI0025D9EFBA|nr:YggT family protein [Tepidibacter sp.]MCT4508511.1 YggT family protein [Tepidibacter sp.]
MYIIIRALGYFVRFLEIMIIIRCVVSFVPSLQYSKFTDFVYRVTEPILYPIRELLYRYTNTGPFDLSPIIAYFLIGWIHGLIMWMIRLVL